MSDQTRSKQIATQNDQFRQWMGQPNSSVPGQALMTAGVAALSQAQQAAILAKVRSFDTFTEDNDPYGEHDFGAIDIEGVGRIFWKIDYYDVNYQFGSEEPSDLAQTRRVLTIMLAEEY